MKNRKYKVVDVFTAEPLLGNPVAVVLDAEGLDTVEMQRIASWTNLSETTFLLPPTSDKADYCLRIFTPRSELPFAGHPTLGSAHAALEAGLVHPRNGKFVQECKVGLVELSATGEGLNRQLMFNLPPVVIKDLQPDDVDELEAILGHPIVRSAAPAIVNVGAIWVVAQMSDVDSLLNLKPDFARSAKFEQRLGVTGLSIYAPYISGKTDLEVRSFAPSCSVNEDPVCGSGNGSIAAFRRARGLLASGESGYLSAQGQCVGRDGRISIQYVGNDQIIIGGACVTSVDGTLRC